MNILGLVVFVIVFGVVLWKLGFEGELFICFFNFFNEVIMVLVFWIMWYVFVGIMFLVVGKIVEMEDVGLFFVCFGKYILCCLLGYVIYGFLVLFFIYFFFICKNFYCFLWGIVMLLVIVFGIFFSFVMLLLMMKCVEENNGVVKYISCFILFIGVIVNMDGVVFF